MSITYLKGDATKPVGGGLKIIIHVANCNNGWGRGFVLALSAKWKEPEAEFRKLFLNTPKSEWINLLGDAQAIIVEKDIVVVNMIAQKGYGKNNCQKHRTSEHDTETPLQLDALDECLRKISKAAEKLENVSIHGPRFGAGLAGGNWNDIEKLINKHLSDLPVFIYDL